MNDTLKPQRLVPIAMAALVLTGVALRIAGARGELFLDEIWTLTLLHPLTEPAQIFALHHDNNHYLNSLWMFALGPAAPVWQLRGLSIVLGTVSIAAAGWWGRRQGIVPALVAMALMAVCYAPVHYGSEARGYAGLILCTLLAFRLTESILEENKGRWLLGLTALTGVLCHLVMGLALVTVGLWAAYVQIRRQPHLLRALYALAWMFWPTALCIAPIAVIVLRSMLAHSFTIGMLNPFSAAEFATSYGLLVRALTGVPGMDQAVPYLALPAIALALAWRWRAGLHGRLPLYLIAIVIVPLALLALKVPNTNQPRYFLVGGIAYLLLLGDLAGIAWSRGKPYLIPKAEKSDPSPSWEREGPVPQEREGEGVMPPAGENTLTRRPSGADLSHEGEVNHASLFSAVVIRIAVMALALVVFTQQAVFLAHFLRDGRGHYREAVRAMTANGPARYASNDDFRNAMIVNFYAAQLGAAATLVKPDGWCAAPPDWYIVYAFSHAAPAPTVTAGPAECPGIFGQPVAYPYWGMSGFQWTLYRRQT